jgi:hypothetical protein
MGWGYPQPMSIFRQSGFTGKELSMPVKSPMRTIEFGEQDEDFVKKLAKDIGCHYCKANVRTFNLNKFDSDIQSEMGVFAWVHKENTDCFWISTRKTWVEEAKAKVLAGSRTSEISCFPRDIQHAEDSVSFNTKDGYQKTVSALRLINNVR